MSIISFIGQTPAPDADTKVLFHFVALTKVGDQLYELDGRKNFPVSHGKTTDDSFLKDMAAVCKKFMARDEKELRFTIMAIAAGEQWVTHLAYISNTMELKNIFIIETIWKHLYYCTLFT